MLKKKDTIISPEEYLEVYSTVGTVLKVGTDFTVKDWKAATTAILKPTSKWHFRFQESKRFIIKRSRKGDALIQGEPNYRVETGVLKSVSRTKVTAQNITPEDLPLGVEVKPAKLRDVNSLLKKHFGEQWMERPDLQWYKDVIQRQSVTHEEGVGLGDTVDPGDEEDEPMVDISMRI